MSIKQTEKKLSEKLSSTQKIISPLQIGIQGPQLYQSIGRPINESIKFFHRHQRNVNLLDGASHHITSHYIHPLR
jgi:hypothetical protein